MASYHAIFVVAAMKSMSGKCSTPRCVQTAPIPQSVSDAIVFVEAKSKFVGDISS